MNRILSLAFTILVALCIEVVMVMLIAHWWGVTAAVIFVAIESVLVLWMFTKSGVHVMKQRNDMFACQNNVDKTLNWKKIFDFDIFGEVYTINICFKSEKISNFAAQN